MANTFGNLPLYEPDDARDDRVRFLREHIPDLDRANSLSVPAGCEPACGWLVMRRGDYVLLDRWATNHQLVIQDYAQLGDVNTNTGPLTFRNLAIVQARCVTRGLAQDADSLYLVEVTDGRGVLQNRWFGYPTLSAYNVRSPAYPQQYYSPSLLAGTAYTWSQLIADLWTQMVAFLGPYPGLPAVPGGTPEGWWFPGCSAWQALCRVLDLCGLQVAAQPLSPTVPYVIVQVGAADAAFTALQTKYRPYLEDDYDYIDGGSGRVPGTIVVYFHRRNSVYGTEETIRRDSLQWAMTPAYSVPVAAPAVFAAAQGTAYLWSDFTVRYDEDNNPLAADVATAAAEAASQAQACWDEIYRGTLGFMRQEYAGALPFVTGAQVDRVTWRQDRRRERRMGWVTSVERGC